LHTSKGLTNWSGELKSNTTRFIPSCRAA
jgi:hypothetical protein